MTIVKSLSLYLLVIDFSLTTEQEQPSLLQSTTPNKESQILLHSDIKTTISNGLVC